MTKLSAIGLMSGTSLDGLDICYCTFEKDQMWHYKILAAETFPYDELWQEKLKNATQIKSDELAALHADYGFYLGEKVAEFCKKYSIEKTDVVGSHGHTVFHQPKKKYTVQIGDGRAIKQRCGFPVVYDFRTQDVLLGGQGAPLVPIGDKLLFNQYDACLNIGGFSNISFDKHKKRLAFDISPVNTILNHYAEKLGKKFDENGFFAKNGSVNPELLLALNRLEYYHQKPPKSLGTEWLQEQVFPLLETYDPQTIIATFTKHTAFQISKVFTDFGLRKILATGGGVHNTYLMELMKQETGAEIVIESQQLSDFKEALIFALMAVLKIVGENNILASATGSLHDHSSGILA